MQSAHKYTDGNGNWHLMQTKSYIRNPKLMVTLHSLSTSSASESQDVRVAPSKEKNSSGLLYESKRPWHKLSII